MMSSDGERLGSGQVAARLGVTQATLRGYLCRARRERAADRDRFSLLPEPDGRQPDGSWWWYPATVDAWVAVRPGPGARTDRFDEATRRWGGPRDG